MNYATYNKELLAIMQALEDWWSLLLVSWTMPNKYSHTAGMLTTKLRRGQGMMPLKTEV
jgi:hypothetical protein